MRPHLKTILIKTIGGQEIGVGHVYRSLALSKELEKEFRVIFHVNDNPHVKTVVQEQGANYFVNEDIEKIVSREAFDLLLLDQLNSDDGLPQRLKPLLPHLKIVALDYFNYENEFVDVIINLFNHNLQKPKPDRDSVQYYEGLEYALINGEFQGYISRAREISPKVRKVLVTFGGVDRRDNTERVLRLLERAEIRDIEVNVVFGLLWDGESPPACDFKIHLSHSITASAMAKLMVEADLAFCGSGTTMMELLAVGTPTVVLPQNLLEERFALHIEKKGAIKVIKDEAQPEDIGYILNLIASPQERERLSRMGKSVIDGKGKERIHKIITGCIQG